jgi:hypothetical protein
MGELRRVDVSTAGTASPPAGSATGAATWHIPRVPEG